MIKSKTSTAEYCAGWDRIFGDRHWKDVADKQKAALLEDVSRACSQVRDDMWGVPGGSLSALAKAGDELRASMSGVTSYMTGESNPHPVRGSSQAHETNGRLSDAEFKAEMSKRLRKELIPDEPIAFGKGEV